MDTARSVFRFAALAAAAMACFVLPPAEAARSARGGVSELQQAFAAAFGQKSARAGAAVARNGLVYTPARLERIGGITALISLGRNREDCLACSGAIAVHYLVRAGTGYRRTGEWLKAAEGSQGGAATRRLLVRHDLSRYSTLASETLASGQGYLCGGVDLIELAPGGPHALAHVPTLYDDGGAGGGVRLSGRIVDVVKDRSFAVRYSGSRTLRVVYRRSGAGFVPSPSSPRPPRCGEPL